MFNVITKTRNIKSPTRGEVSTQNFYEEAQLVLDAVREQSVRLKQHLTQEELLGLVPNSRQAT